MNPRNHSSPERFISDINNAKKLKKENITKVITNIDSNIDSLVNKKFKLNSAFDHKGSKNFLNSKKIALQQIILDDDESTDSDPKNLIIKQKKDSNKHKKFCGKSLTKEERIHVNSNNPTVMKNSIKKKKGEKKLLNEYFSNVIGSSINNKKNFNNKKTNEKLPHKFYSNQELKMFEDKEIKKIRSIKKNKRKSKKKNIVNENISFIEKNDSSIFDIIAQL